MRPISVNYLLLYNFSFFAFSPFTWNQIL